MREKLSAFVIAYNRASLLETCLRAVSFADELIVIDKSSTDDSVAIAARYADRVEVVPWSPTVEETRAFAVSLCRHEWILFLDDDEILSPESGPCLGNSLGEWNADILTIPLRHYILGVHDERAYYWPEVHHRLFRRGAVEFIPTVHGGVALQSDRIANIPVDSGVCIHHLSYRDVASWIERTNRYTSRPDRVQSKGGEVNLIRFAHDQIDFWMQRTADPSCNDYPAAVALLRAIYDMVDRLKAWETERGLDGNEMFQIAQKNLTLATERRQARAGVMSQNGTRQFDVAQTVRVGERCEAAPLQNSLKDMELRAIVVQLRATEAHLRERTEAERKSTLNLICTRNELDDAIVTLAGTRNDLNETKVTLGQTQATLRETRVTLDQTRTTLGQTGATLAATRETLDQSVANLTEVNLELARLSGSARLFVRQYLPKLRRQFSRRLVHARIGQK
ncbi:MAG: glycosyltransferase [Acetobacteraceae bacterium]|jgi:hypothetical protein